MIAWVSSIEWNILRIVEIGKKAGTVSFATFLSRIFGLVRDQLFAALMGAGFFSDAYFIAFRIPNLLRDLFAEGALSSAFVPTFTEYEVRRSQKEAWELANLVMGVLCAVVGTLTLFGMIFTPQVVAVIAPGFGDVPGKMELTVLLTRIMFPFLLIIAISALFMGMLNVKGEFSLPAFAPVMFNLVSIFFGIALWSFGASGRVAVIGWSVGTLIGGLVQGGIQIPSLFKHGFRFRSTLAGWRNNKGLRQIAMLMIPALIANSGIQVNILVNSILASLLDQGSPSWLNYAFRLMQLPIGVFGVAISVVTLSTLSRDVASLSKEAKEGFQSNVTSSLNLVFLLTIPCAVGLWILGVPIVRLIFERGAFTSNDTLATASAITCYAIGLPTYAAVKVLAPIFFPLKDSKIPMIASLIGVGINIIFNLLVYEKLRHPGLALGTSLGMMTNFGILVFWLQFRHGGLPWKAILKQIGLVGLATTCMAFVALYTNIWLTTGRLSLGYNLLNTLVPIAVASFAYFLILSLFGVPEMDLVKKAFRKISQRLLSF